MKEWTKPEVEKLDIVSTQDPTGPGNPFPGGGAVESHFPGGGATGGEFPGGPR